MVSAVTSSRGTVGAGTPAVEAVSAAPAGERISAGRKRRLGAAALAGGLLLSAVSTATAQAAPARSAAATATPAPTVSAKGAYLLDRTTGKALFAKDAGTSRQMASTTKVMTATVVLGRPKLDLKRLVTVKQTYRDYVTQVGGSTADLRTGDKLTVGQLLYALMLPSGCDAAYALADTYGTGSTTAARVKSFIGMMNTKARELGLKNTHYDSFDGISSKGANYTTPRDSAVLAGKALGYGTLRTVVGSAKTVQKATNGRTYTWYNTNRLLGSYQGAIGVKTGTGTAAGPCLVFAAVRGGHTVIGVLLNDASRYDDAVKMLNYAFHVPTAKTAPMRLRVLPAGAQRD
ncbi:D-alanyl-D-alanine carboxypeptidase family protein [Streptantibioticus cattleyicolor]|uniref:D-alanyl-D-alanine carboxypeptidase n=1 Tax=Streptantibioticus cattleyicolor (strain ATCC 35852 / DSM 46488 / JCM 4925 / NBRC 14057 / NRRL 8057) TaxID=1003195 RepID=F8JK09_STREN|nr:serine hydrolase [Streptantibioticus cattleyicolor]AEW99856.1 D-alanyl-D-alanine carboxypeptidase [Streptantibioticus cattleyicolor NRRL 8057 = DSM 46488]CCB71108.1 D-alanyl-D-alanine carboxypeptidase [Streptantibioticus cattleyicolor NRRL 8057 = DSM 46488]